MLDKSGSIYGANFHNIKTYVRDIIDHLEIGPHANQVGVVTFSSDAFFDIKLDKHHSKEELQREIMELKFQNQMTNISGMN